MPMTIKMHKRFAANIREALREANDRGTAHRDAINRTIENLAMSIAESCKEDNPRQFRYDHFFEWCGLDGYGKVKS